MCGGREFSNHSLPSQVLACLASKRSARGAADRQILSALSTPGIGPASLCGNGDHLNFLLRAMLPCGTAGTRLRNAPLL